MHDKYKTIESAKRVTSLKKIFLLRICFGMFKEATDNAELTELYALNCIP